MTSQELHDLTMAIVDTALDRAPAERSALLDASCGDDAGLRREVESLLAFEETTEAWVGDPLISLLPPEPDDRDRVGPYTIVRRLGHGGMGTVYLGRQEEPVRRQVALKLIQPGMDVDEFVRRFQIERNILADLHHPYIAALLDAGATADGRPYFAMEYVDGSPIDVYCDEARLSIRERLELFLKVCSAVELAHRNLVVHRDLKADNILVDASGIPKLLDFGIAKLLEASPGAASVTLAAPGPMTLACASPEMIRGENVTTVSDIYSLGVLLYRLLSGHHPYLVYGLPLDEIIRTIREEEPPPPSVAVERRTQVGSVASRTLREAVAERRGTVPGKLRRQLAGDLDGIVAKALAKNPQGRYGSAGELADDIRRHLEILPVVARPATFRYRAGKLVRRHRWGFTVAASFLLLLVGVAVATTVLYRQAVAERNRARMTQDLFVEALESTDSRDEEDNLTVEEVVQRGVELYDESFRGNLEVQANVLEGLGRIYRSRNHLQSARPLLEAALQIRREVFGEDHLLVGETLINLGALLESQGLYRPAADSSGRGLEILRKHYGRPHGELAKAINTYASQLYRLRDFDAAEPLYLEALEMKTKIYGDRHREVATSLALVGNMRLVRRNYEEARRYYQEALDIRSARLPPAHPALAGSYLKMGTVLTLLGAYDESLPMLRRALDIRLDVMGPEHVDVGNCHFSLGFSLHRLDRHEEAEEHYRESLRLRCANYGEDHKDCINVKKNLALVLAAQGEAETALQLALETRASAGRSRPEDQWRVYDVDSVVGECHVALGRFDEAEPLLLTGYSGLLEKRGEEAVQTQDARQRLCRLYEVWGKPEKAAEFCE